MKIHSKTKIKEVEIAKRLLNSLLKEGEAGAQVDSVALPGGGIQGVVRRLGTFDGAAETRAVQMKGEKFNAVAKDKIRGLTDAERVVFISSNNRPLFYDITLEEAKGVLIFIKQDITKPDDIKTIEEMKNTTDEKKLVEYVDELSTEVKKLYIKQFIKIKSGAQNMMVAFINNYSQLKDDKYYQFAYFELMSITNKIEPIEWD